MVQYKKIEKNLIGYMRATEVTVNDTDNSYNQHMHVLFVLSLCTLKMLKIMSIKNSGLPFGKSDEIRLRSGGAYSNCATKK